MANKNQSMSKMLSLGKKYYERGNTKNALKYYTLVLQKQPDHQEANERVTILRKKIQSRSPHLKEFNKMTALFENENYDKAIEQSKLLLKIEPRNPTVWALRGSCFTGLGQYELAIENYDKAIALNPSYSAAFRYKAHAFLKCGKIDEAIINLMQAIKLEPQHSETWDILSRALLNTGKNEELRIYATVGLSEYPKLLGPRLALSTLMLYEHDVINALTFLIEDPSLFNENSNDPEKFQILIRIARLGWMLRRIDFVANPVKLILEGLKPASDRERNTMEFSRYLALLHNWINQNPWSPPVEPELIMIGDSHSLSPGGQILKLTTWTRTIHSRVIEGCKAFHLASKNENLYQHSIRKILNDTPPDVPIILSIGEIDCRLDEGFIAALKKGSITDLDASISEVVNDYISFVLAIRDPRNLKIAFQGVQAPNRNWSIITSEDKSQLIYVIKRFNYHLKTRCELDDVYFIDVHNLTSNNEGVSNKLWHLDDFHLIPTYLQEVLSKSNVDFAIGK